VAFSIRIVKKNSHPILHPIYHI